ncbi:hypothetical protein SDC9_166504 [bioreactor metagenome]|uniref:Uncharacterized protein n=1 Tax=bioreactor metagenome TaxID=1076179 RepID=A0A645FX77_9ZZZZ
MVDGTDGILGLVVVHHPQGQVKRVGADVDQRPSALLMLIEEDTPGGHGTAADGVSLGVVHIAQFTGFAGGLQIEAVGAVAVLITDRQKLSCFFGRIQHLLCFRIADRHRLFAHDMLARTQSVHGNDAVAAVGRTDIDRVQVKLQQILVVCKYFCVRGAELLGSRDSPLLANIAEGDDIRAAGELDAGQVLVIGDTAAPDDTKAKPFHYLPPKSMCDRPIL